MHESSLTRNLVGQIEQVASSQQASRISHVEIQLGALTFISPEHLREHLALALQDTVAEDASIEILVQANVCSSDAQMIRLTKITVAEVDE